MCREGLPESIYSKCDISAGLVIYLAVALKLAVVRLPIILVCPCHYHCSIGIWVKSLLIIYIHTFPFARNIVYYVANYATIA